MQRIVLKEEYRKTHIMKPISSKVKKSVNIMNGVLTAIEIMSTGKTVRAARLLKEIIDIFAKR
jgi:hypothetical protein